MVRSLLILLSICFFVSFATTASADVRDDLQGIRREIREKKTLIKKTRKIEKKVSSELVNIDKNLKEKEANLKALTLDLVKVEQTLDKTQREIQIVAAEAERKREHIRHRLTALYKAGELGSARMFFASESFPQMLENQKYMQGVLQGDRRLFADYSAKLDQLKGLKGVLERDAERKENIRTGIAAKKQEIEEEKSKKAAYLDQVRATGKSHQAALRELQANARRLQTMIETAINTLNIIHIRSTTAFPSQPRKGPISVRSLMDRSSLPTISKGMAIW